jgi:hypothetical protein
MCYADSIALDTFLIPVSLERIAKKPADTTIKRRHACGDQEVN